jgi:hypothetical protein
MVKVIIDLITIKSNNWFQCDSMHDKLKTDLFYNIFYFFYSFLALKELIFIFAPAFGGKMLLKG